MPRISNPSLRGKGRFKQSSPLRESMRCPSGVSLVPSCRSAHTMRRTAEFNKMKMMQHDAGGKSRPPWPKDSIVNATFSPCSQYRYSLSEVWDLAKPLVLWVLMNPSVACTNHSDPTLRKTGNFARAWGYGGQLVANVHAYRATDKSRLLTVSNPVGPDNDRAIVQMAQRARTIVLAYGQPPEKLKKRGQEVVDMLIHHPGLSYLRLAKDGITPVHPLYLPACLEPKPYKALAR